VSGDEQELPRLALDVESLLRVFRDHGVSFVLVGGTALIVHGAIDRVTYDLDVVPAASEDNLGRLAAALHELEARVITGWDPVRQELAVERSAYTPEMFRDNPFLHLVTNAGRVDVLLAPTGIPGGYDQLIDKADLATLAGGDVTLASLEDLIAMKRAVDRAKDRADLDHIRGVHRAAATSDLRRSTSKRNNETPSRDRTDGIER